MSRPCYPGTLTDLGASPPSRQLADCRHRKGPGVTDTQRAPDRLRRGIDRAVGQGHRGAEVETTFPRTERCEVESSDRQVRQQSEGESNITGTSGWGTRGLRNG